MINLWGFTDTKRIRIADIDGDIFEGNIIDITDSGDRSDLEPDEDCITIATDKGNIQL